MSAPTDGVVPTAVTNQRQGVPPSSSASLFGSEAPYTEQAEDHASCISGNLFYTWLGDLMHKASREELTQEGLPRPMRAYRAYNVGVRLSEELRRQQERRHAWDGHIGARVGVRWDAASDGVLRWVGAVQQYGTPDQLYAGVEWLVAPARRDVGVLRRLLLRRRDGAPPHGPGAFHRGEVDGEFLFELPDGAAVATCERVEDVVFYGGDGVADGEAGLPAGEDSVDASHLQRSPSSRCRSSSPRAPQPFSTGVALFRAFRWQLLLLGPLRVMVDGSALLTPLALGWYISLLQASPVSPSSSSSSSSADGVAYSSAATPDSASSSRSGEGGAYVDTLTALGSVLLLFLLNLARSVALQKYAQLVARYAYAARSALSACVAGKCMRISPRDLQRPELNVGRIVNFLATDVGSVESTFFVLWMTITVPLQLCMAIYLLYRSMGWAAAISLLMLAVSLPLLVILTKLTYRCTVAMSKRTDARLRSTNELLSGIRSVKFMSLEGVFESEINARRAAELRSVRRFQLVSITSFLLTQSVPSITTATVIIAYYFTGEPMSPSVIYPALSLLGLMDTPFELITYLAGVYSQFFVSMRRLSSFLAADDAAARAVLGEMEADGEASAAAAVFAHAAISSYKPVPLSTPHWWRDAGEARFELRVQTLLEDVDLCIPRGKLTVVLGPTGSGKSTLLDSLIGALAVTRGRVACSRRVAYVPQQPWIMNATLRDNVVFFGAADAAALERAVASSQLAADLALLADGVDTEIGEKGINLSGGQRARVGLARAVYADRDVYVLDDPLSALDAHVGERVMRECVCGALACKTRVLATHQVHVARDADYVVLLEGGRVAFQGTRDEYYRNHMSREMSDNVAAESKPPFDATAASYDPSTATEVTNCDVLLDGAEAGGGSAEVPDTSSAGRAEGTGNLLTKEERFRGAVPFTVYRRYMEACGGLCVCVAVVVLYLATEVLVMAPSIWLALWSTGFLPLNSREYSVIYVLLSMIGAVCGPMRYWVSMTVMRRASYVVHGELLRSVTCATLQFFDTTPIGRLISRFTNDIRNIDSDLQSSYSSLLSTVSSFISTVAMMAFTQVFVVAVLVPCMVAYYFLLRFYARANREIKRLVNLVNSPVLSVLEETLGGRWTIQAYRVAPAVLKKVMQVADVVFTCSYLQLGAELWLSVRIQLLSTSITLAVALGAVAAVHVAFLPANVGLLALSVTLSMQISGLLNGIISVLASVEADMNSVERIFYMTDNIEHEDLRDAVSAGVDAIHAGGASHVITAAIDDTPTTASSVSSPLVHRQSGDTEFGSLLFEHVDMRYRPGLPLVLRDVSFAIAPGQRVGVVGRTGSGKSTLLLAFLRLVEVCGGCMRVCGRDAQSYTLPALRCLFSMIPQDPVLFDGTVRSNVDPFGDATDAEVQRALTSVGFVSGSLNGGGAGEGAEGSAEGVPALDTVVQEGGANFSVGQRQLLCLARALLKRGSAFLLMDEATANVDPALDRQIQLTVQQTFRDYTVVTIAHRLHTVAAYDAILVMDGGRAVEFGSPRSLLENRSSAFYGMVAQSSAVVSAVARATGAGGGTREADSAVGGVSAAERQRRVEEVVASFLKECA